MKKCVQDFQALPKRRDAKTYRLVETNLRTAFCSLQGNNKGCGLSGTQGHSRRLQAPEMSTAPKQQIPREGDFLTETF